MSGDQDPVPINFASLGQSFCGIWLGEMVSSPSLFNVDKNEMNVFKNFVKHLCKEGMTTEEMSKIVGIEPRQLQKFVDILVKEDKIKKEGDKYFKK